MAFSILIGGHGASRIPSSGSGTLLVPPFSQLVGFLLLLGFVVQGTAIQTHLHFARQASSALVASSDRFAQAAKPNKDDSPANCPLCQEAAMAGAFVLPSAAVLPPPPAAVVWIVRTTLATFGLLTRAHSWQSRAPPR